MPEILVCQAGTCRRHGAEAVIMEIEELVDAVGPNSCSVEASGCLGLCRKAPNAVIIDDDGREEEFTRLKSLDRTIEVVKSATGEIPNMANPEMQVRLRAVRAMRAREEALLVYRWNSALGAIQEQLDLARVGNDTQKQQDAKGLYKMVSRMAGFHNMNEDGSFIDPLQMPAAIENYSQWSLVNVSVVSRHTAIFHFISSDLKRGTPHPRGRGRKPPSPITWHTTMLAEVGQNAEGPLPWIERDYTPVSSAKEWENGKCDILIKIYNDGAATSWLHRIAYLSDKFSSSSVRPCVWLSKPIRTLRIPSLTVEKSKSRLPESVLLILAGTGVVALPQILYHRNPQTSLGISTPSKCQLEVPIDMILSCRADDVLMLPEIIQFCQESRDADSDSLASKRAEKGLRNCVLLLTEADSNLKSYPFGATSEGSDENGGIDTLGRLDNTQIIYSRLTPKIVEDSLSKMSKPYRVVVSGPAGFNAAARDILRIAGAPHDDITVLEA